MTVLFGLMLVILIFLILVYVDSLYNFDSILDVLLVVRKHATQYACPISKTLLFCELVSCL